MRRIDELFKIIADATEELKRIREACPHEHTKECNFAYERHPNINWAEVCDDCNTPLKNLGLARFKRTYEDQD